MSDCHLITVSDDTRPQSEQDKSFIGGIPSLPSSSSIPACDLCGTQQTFYFQIAFPDQHDWSDVSLAVFECTSCMTRDSVIPEMLSGPLRGIDIPAGFLTSYQRNFRLMVFDTSDGSSIDSYKPKVAFKRLALESSDDSSAGGSKIGGRPTWLLDDETPGSYADDTAMVFLMQLDQGIEFETVPGAPPQIKLALDGTPTPADRDYYQLFIGNFVYFFGTADKTLGAVYALTQID